MKILSIDARYRGQTDFAMPFETDAEVVAAWQWLPANDYLNSFSYRPGSEGVDLGRVLVETHLAAYDSGTPLPPLDAKHIRAVVGQLYQDDLHHKVRELIDPSATAEPAVGNKI